MQSYWLRGMARVFVRSGGRAKARRGTSRRRPALDALEGRVLLSDGVLDTTFGTDGRQVVPFDLGLSNQDQAFAMAVQDDGKIVLAGRARTAPAGFDFAVVRLNVDGTPDAGFGPGGKRTIGFGSVGSLDDARGVAIAPDGKIVVVGQVEGGVGLDFDFGVARLNPDGTLDTTFDEDGKRTVSFSDGFDLANAVVVQADRKIVVGGTVPAGATDTDFGVLRLNEDGSLDTTFHGDGMRTVSFNLGGNGDDKLNALALSDTKIILAGYIPRGSVAPGSSIPAAYDFALARLNGDGTADTTFDGDGKQNINVGGNGHSEAVNAVIALANGKIVVAGQSQPNDSTDSDFAVLRLNEDGAPDASFDGDGRKMIAFNLMPGGRDIGRALVVAPGDMIIVAGEAQRSGNNFDMAAVRLTDTGDLDAEFGTGGRQTVFFDLGGDNADAAYGVGLQPDGKVVLGGSALRSGTIATGGNLDFAATRLGPDPTANNPPAAADDPRATNEDTPLVIDVLANDTDVDGDPLTASLVAGPANGTLGLSGAGSFTYTPNGNFNGTDSFTYVANDGQANSNTATVTITVTAVNDAPVAVNDARTTVGGTPLTIPVLANDTDSEGNALTASRVAGPANGTLALNADGTFTYTPNGNFVGADSFTYVANDGTASSNPATVTITVTVPPDVVPPQAVQARLVRSVVRVGRRRVRVVTLEAAFNEAMNPALAASSGFYQVAEIAGTRRRPRFRNVAIREASYDPATRIARLTLVGNRPFARGGRLIIQPVADLAGNALDGNGDGVAGDAATLSFPRR